MRLHSVGNDFGDLGPQTTLALQFVIDEWVVRVLGSHLFEIRDKFISVELGLTQAVPFDLFFLGHRATDLNLAGVRVDDDVVGMEQGFWTGVTKLLTAMKLTLPLHLVVERGLKQFIVGRLALALDPVKKVGEHAL